MCLLGILLDRWRKIGDACNIVASTFGARDANRSNNHDAWQGVKAGHG